MAGQARHDLRLRKDASVNYFDSEGVDREPYMAPGLVTAEKVAKGKLPTDVWWHTIVPTNGSEKTGLSEPEAGGHRRGAWSRPRPGPVTGASISSASGTLGAVAAPLGRHYVLVDSNPEAIEIARAQGWGSPKSRPRSPEPSAQSFSSFFISLREVTRWRLMIGAR